MCRLVVALKYFTELFLFLLYIRKDQAQEQSDWKLWCRCNKQKNGCLTGNYNQLHNILRLFDVLPNFPFITSETIRNYYL